MNCQYGWSGVPGIVSGGGRIFATIFIPRRGVLVPSLARTREFVLELHQADDLVDGLRRHADHRYLVPRLIDRCFGPRDTRP
jgi:hypothetical protein